MYFQLNPKYVKTEPFVTEKSRFPSKYTHNEKHMETESELQTFILL